MSERSKAQAAHRRSKIEKKRRREHGVQDHAVTVLGKCGITTKNQYSKHDAQLAAKNMMRREKYRIDFYYCFHCHFWHIGHDKKRGRFRVQPK